MSNTPTVLSVSTVQAGQMTNFQQCGFLALHSDANCGRLRNHFASTLPPWKPCPPAPERLLALTTPRQAI